MYELVLFPFVIITFWLIVQAAPWVLGVVAGLLVIGLIVGRGKKS